MEFQRTGRSRADLVRLFANVPRTERALAAATLGFVKENEVEPKIEISLVNADSVDVSVEPTLDDSQESLSVTPIVQIPLWRFEGMTFRDEPEHIEPARPQVQGLTPEDLHGAGQSLFAMPKANPLAAWSKLWPRLRHVLQGTVPSREPDLGQWVRRISQGEIVTRIPRLQRKAWPARLSIWIDRSRRLVPFWSDQMDVVRNLYKVCDRRGLEIRWLDARMQASLAMRRGDFAENVSVANETPVLLLGDLGFFGTEADRLAWRMTGKRLREKQMRLSALLPVSKKRWTPGISRIWNGVSWEQGRSRLGMSLAKETKTSSERTDQLLKIVSPAAYVQPGLLRALRLLLPPDQADASTEADVWNHADVRSADATGFVLQSEAAEKWRNAFAAEFDAAFKERVSRTITHWHTGLPRELLRAETLVWLSVAPDVEAPGNVRDALDFASRLEGSAMASGDDPQWADLVKRYGHALLAGMPEAIYERIPALQTVWVAAFQGGSAPKSIDPSEIRRKLERPGETRHWYVRQVGASWVFGLNERGTEWASYIQGPGSPLAWFEASRPWLTIVRGQTVEEVRLEPGLTLSFDLNEPVELRTDRCTVRMAPWVRESWTIAAGRDRYGLWADASIRGVVQRFRWIPPGRFLMGSPESEVGRYDDEGPQHWVTWTKGRWFGDTPVTQGLWEAIMGSNPSRFQTPDRPVEMVSWDNCQEFLVMVNDLDSKLDARLPTEEEWEYGCRAGTTTATWVGDFELIDLHLAPALDFMAWYGGNCGVSFEASGSSNEDHWPRAHQPQRSGIRAVGQKAPNPWGLFDILGNVWEWCADTYAPYQLPVANKIINRNDAFRVMRGGCAGSSAREVRAASRYTLMPHRKYVCVGFRLARDADPDPSKQGSG